MRQESSRSILSLLSCGERVAKDPCLESLLESQNRSMVIRGQEKRQLLVLCSKATVMRRLGSAYYVKFMYGQVLRTEPRFKVISRQRAVPVSYRYPYHSWRGSHNLHTGAENGDVAQHSRLMKQLAGWLIASARKRGRAVKESRQHALFLYMYTYCVF